MLQVSLLRQSLGWVEKLAAADTCTPNAYVVRVLQLGEVGKEAMVVEVVNLFFASQFVVACQCDYLHSRSHDEESHVETYLVVAGTGRTVCNGIGTNLLGVAGYRNGLEDAL